MSKGIASKNKEQLIATCKALTQQNEDLKTALATYSDWLEQRDFLTKRSNLWRNRFVEAEALIHQLGQALSQSNDYAVLLLNANEHMAEYTQQLEDEIAILRGQECKEASGQT